MSQIPILNGMRFYVYEHRRADTGAVFYVGKGSGRRARVTSHHHRNEHWQRIVAKAGGFSVRMVAEHLGEELAFLVECERINQMRRLGVGLSNQTDGGDGTSGWVKSQEWREKVGEAHRGKVISQETRTRISASVMATGYRHSEETRKQMGESRRGIRNMLGKRHTDETKQRMRLAHANDPAPALMTCPNCGKTGAGGSMVRWHFERCREK